MADADKTAAEVVKNIDDLMHEKRISQLDLEKKTGIDHKRISRYVNGENRITLEAAVALSEGLGTTLDEMLPPGSRSLSPNGEEGTMVKGYRRLNRANKKKLEDYLRLLLMDQG